jgi:MFS family permease/quinol monooxygenase YgiN
MGMRLLGVLKGRAVTETADEHVLGDEARGGAWSPLRLGLFRALWLAALVSNIGTWMQNVAAVWYMTSLTSSPLLVTLVQAATSLPVFLVGLPAGAVADIFDRRRLLLWTQGWMLAVAGVLAVLTFGGFMTEWRLLALTFALGLGTAMNAPSWQAITPDVVPRPDLPRAIALNSVTVNIGRAVGPALGGVLVAASGPALVFALNALSFLGVLAVVYHWSRPPTSSVLPAERVFGAIRAGLRYARHAPPLAAVLVRTGLFMICASAFWALLPVIARGELGASAVGYGVLLGCVGLGATAGAALLPRFRGRLSLDSLTGLATVVFAVVCVLTALWRWLPGLWVVMVIGGLAWIAMMASLNTAAQTTAPPWVRARALGMYLVVFQGGLGLGSALWGGLAERMGTPTALVLSGAALVVGLAAIPRWRLAAATRLDLTASAHWPEPHAAAMPAADAGPVHVQVEYRIDPEQAGAFSAAVHELGAVRRRDGAIAWSLYRDPAEAGRYVEVFVVESWVEHRRQHERVTKTDRAIEDRVRGFHRGDSPPAVTHLIASRRGSP